MDRQEHPNRKTPTEAEDQRCILCEAIIELCDHEIFVATGRCRHCHEALEAEE